MYLAMYLAMYLCTSCTSRRGTSFIPYLVIFWGYFHPGIFAQWDTEPGILNDTLNDPSLPPPHLWFTYLPRDNTDTIQDADTIQDNVDTKEPHSNLLGVFVTEPALLNDLLALLNDP